MEKFKKIGWFLAAIAVGFLVLLVGCASEEEEEVSSSSSSSVSCLGTSESMCVAKDGATATVYTHTANGDIPLYAADPIVMFNFDPSTDDYDTSWNWNILADYSADPTYDYVDPFDNYFAEWDTWLMVEVKGSLITGTGTFDLISDGDNGMVYYSPASSTAVYGAGDQFTGTSASITITEHADATGDVEKGSYTFTTCKVTDLYTPTYDCADKIVLTGDFNITRDEDEEVD